MAKTTTTKKTPPAGGLTQEERAALLAEVEAVPAVDASPRLLSPRERLIAAELRERDHFDGCPVVNDPTAGAQVEAFEEVAIAPGPPLRSVGVAKGDPVITIRCLRCAGSRYVPSPAPPNTPVGHGRHINALIAARLRAEGDAPAADELDGTI